MGAAVSTTSEAVVAPLGTNEAIDTTDAWSSIVSVSARPVGSSA